MHVLKLPVHLGSIIATLLVLGGCAGSSVGLPGPLDTRAPRAPQPTEPEGELGRALDEYLRAAADSGYSGVVLVASQGRVILHKGYGWADRDKGLPLRADAVFALSSIDKTFTAAAIMKLVQEQRLNLSDPVSKHVSALPTDKAGITVEQLLLHTSGLPLDVARDAEPLTVAELLKRTAAAKLKSEPGETWLYSNLGYSLLALIVESVTGEPFEAYAQRELFAPAGLTDTRYRRPEEADGVGYCGYKFFYPQCLPDRTRLIEDGPTWSLRGNSGRVSTAADLFRWTEALKEGRPLSLSTQQVMNTPRVATTIRGSMGYGWFVENDASWGKVVSHTGGDGVVAANWRRFTDRDLVIVEFTNNSRGGAYRAVSDAIVALALGGPVNPLPSAAATPSLQALEGLTGTYALPSGERFLVQLKNGQLFVPLSTPGVAKYLSSQPSLPDAGLHTAAAGAVTAVLESVERREYGALRASLPQNAAYEEERAFWSSYWPAVRAEQGTLRQVSAIGSAMERSALDPTQQVPEVRLVVVLERGVQYMKAQRLADGWYLNVSNDAPLPPGGFRLLPQGGDEFITYVFANGAMARLQFTSSRGARQLRISTEKAEVIAVQQRSPGANEFHQSGPH